MNKQILGWAIIIIILFWFYLTKNKNDNKEVRMNKLFIILFTIFFSTNSSVGYSKGEKYIDSDWNMTFYNHCGFPSSKGKEQNVKWVEKDENKFLRFSLYNGQVGKCSNDHKKRKKGEPYTERADIKQWSKLEKGFQ